MSDFLLNLGRNSAARSVAGGLGFNLPPELRRAEGPWAEDELAGRTIGVGGGTLGGRLLGAFAGATELVGDGLEGTPLGEERVDALVFDGTGLASADDLDGLYAFFHAHVRQVRSNGRVLVLAGEPSAMATPSSAAAVAGVEGFVRSLSKELGRKGTTANLVRVAAGAEDHALGVIRFFLTDRSCFVTAQPLHVSAFGPADAPTHRPLDGQTAVVTGAARGIGRAIAQRLAEEGARVLCVDRPDDGTLQSVADELGGVAVPCDVTDEAAGATLAAAAEGGIDVVVHNAGVTRDRTVARMSEAEWGLVLDVNLRAILRIDEHLLAGPLNDGGRIVLLSSIGGIGGNPGQTNYGATKAAMAGYARFLAPTVADRGIGVAAVAPGLIETAMTAKMPVMVREGGRRLATLSQGGLPLDVAEVVTLLASPAGLPLTGNLVRVCGGNLMGA